MISFSQCFFSSLTFFLFILSRTLDHQTAVIYVFFWCHKNIDFKDSFSKSSLGVNFISLSWNFHSLICILKRVYAPYRVLCSQHQRGSLPTIWASGAAFAESPVRGMLLGGHLSFLSSLRFSLCVRFCLHVYFAWHWNSFAIFDSLFFFR